MGKDRTPMRRRATIDDVARLAGVHKATVSRALNARTEHHVGRQTAERVRAAAEKLGYVPNAMARGLRTANSMTIGVILPDLTNPLFPPMVRGIENFLQPRGYTALLANTDDHEATETSATRSLLARRVDGLIVASGHSEFSALAEAREAGVPTVLLNRDAGSLRFPLVTGDDATGIEQAVAHLAELGHRDLLHIAGPPRLSTSTNRKAAFEAACARIPGLRHRVVEVEALTIDAGYRAMDAILRAEADRPTAIVAGNDLIALGVLRSLRAHRLECPAGVSVVGFNDMLFAADFTPPLTTVRVPTLEMGAAAARMLLEIIETGDEPSEPLCLPVALVVRGSTGPP
jgi:LacI family transcriptional regulator